MLPVPAKAVKTLRNFLSLLLLSVYLLFSIGIIKATHFCMGREASVQFFKAETTPCACPVYVQEDDSCCNDKHELLKIEGDQKTFSTFTVGLPVWKIERIYTERFFARDIVLENIGRFEQLKSQPKIPLWKAHKSFVFYDDASA
jgi:hypothetical protein